MLRAPIDGVIIKRDVNPGQTVAVALEAKTLFTIANDLSRLEVHGKIDEADIGKLKVGQMAQFTVDSSPERDFSGTVLRRRSMFHIDGMLRVFPSVCRRHGKAPLGEAALDKRFEHGIGDRALNQLIAQHEK